MRSPESKKPTEAPTKAKGKSKPKAKPRRVRSKKTYYVEFRNANDTSFQVNSKLVQYKRGVGRPKAVTVISTTMSDEDMELADEMVSNPDGGHTVSSTRQFMEMLRFAYMYQIEIYDRLRRVMAIVYSKYGDECTAKHFNAVMECTL